MLKMSLIGRNARRVVALGGNVSPTLPINASIIQGSGLGPVHCVFTASDLHPISPFNQFCKYADCTYLLVPSSNSLSIPSEIQHISDWATANNLKLNNSRSHEMIVHLPPTRKFFFLILLPYLASSGWTK